MTNANIQKMIMQLLHKTWIPKKDDLCKCMHTMNAILFFILFARENG